MNKTLKTTIIIAGVAALGYFLYTKYKKPSAKTEVTPADLKPEENIELGSAVDPSKSALLPEERA